MDDRLQHDPDTSAAADRFVAEGEEAVSRGDWACARTAFEAALAAAPGSWKALQGLGVVGFWQGRHDEAWEMLVAAVRMAPDDADNVANLLDVARSCGREEEAHAILAAIVAGEASPAEEHCDRGETMLEAELWPEATRVFLEAIDRDLERSRAWSGLGIACFRSGLPNAARAFFEMAFRLDPADEDAVLNWSESSGMRPDEIEAFLTSAGVAPALVAKAIGAAS